MTAQEKYIRNILTPWKFKLFMLKRLPSVVFWGVSIQDLNTQECSVSIPFKWRTQNPFSSIYFAALAGAAELSTGALCQLHLAGREHYSMLVTGFKADYFKKADSLIRFHCHQGNELKSLLDGLVNAGDTGTITLYSTGTNKENIKVARAEITWSFRKK